jgi:hypothetical protein
MSPVIPQTKFSPDETPWARWAEAAITALQADSILKTQNDLNVNQGQSATITALGGAIQSINQTIANQKTVPRSASVYSSAIALPSGGTSYTASLIGPPNITQCSYVMLVYGSGVNFLGVTMQAPSSYAATAPAAAGAAAYVNTGDTGWLHGLTPGQTLNFQAMVYSSGSWAANAGNSMRIQVMGLFMP